MNPVHCLRMTKRYAGRLRPQRAALDSLGGALHTLLQATPRADPFFLGHGLDLLQRQMGADLAYLVTVEGDRFETRWWSPEREGDAPPVPVQAFCYALMEDPHRTLVLRDCTRSRFLSGDPEARALGIQAAAGATLWSEDRIKGLVFLHYAAPHAFTRAELALLDAVASFLGRVLEVEDLRSSLRNLETALDITRAVVQDTSIQDPDTELPNLRYLDIWLKAKLAQARKKRNTMTVAEIHLPDPGPRIQKLAEGVRAGDLVVSEGRDRYLLVLQHTTEKKGHAFLERLRSKLGDVPMGITLWTPGVDDLSFVSVRRRLELALAESRALPQAPMVWKLEG